MMTNWGVMGQAVVKAIEKYLMKILPMPVSTSVTRQQIKEKKNLRTIGSKEVAS